MPIVPTGYNASLKPRRFKNPGDLLVVRAGPTDDTEEELVLRPVSNGFQAFDANGLPVSLTVAEAAALSGLTAHTGASAGAHAASAIAVAGQQSTTAQGAINSLYGRCVYVDDFGADPTGVADSSAAIQAAINSFPERGGSVLFGDGTYKCDSTLIVGNSTILMGLGGMLAEQASTEPTLVYHPATHLDFTGLTDSVAIKTDDTATYRCQGVRLKGFLMTGSGSTNGKTAIALLPGLHPIPKVGLAFLDDVYITNFSTGVNLSTSDSTTLNECWINNVTTGMSGGGSECKFQGGGFWRVSGNIWTATSGDRFSVLNAEIEPDNAAGKGVNFTTVIGVTIANCKFRPPFDIGIQLSGATTDVVINGNQVECGNYFVYTSGITSRITATGNSVRVSTGAPISAFYLRSTATSPAISLTGNVVGGAYSSAVLDITTSAGTRIKNNYFGTAIINAGSVITTSAHDLEIDGNVVNITDTRAGAGAISINTRTTNLVTTGTDALTLADGQIDQRKTITMVAHGGDGTLAPTTKTGFTTVVFSAVGQSVTLRWASASLGWMVESNNGAAVA